MMRHTFYTKVFRRSFNFLLLLMLSLISIGEAAQPLQAIIDTSKGKIVVQLNERAAPTTVANFANLAMRGFYDGLTFHRVERNFMAQGGDPLANGSGDAGYSFTGELVLHHNQPGIISMANAGPGTDGSQFFLTHVATPFLNGKHSVFGKVSSGMRVVNQLKRRDTINSIVIEGDTSSLFERRRELINEWNAILDERYPSLRAAQ